MDNQLIKQQMSGVAKIAPKLAHDIKKPLSMIIMSLDMLKSMNDLDSMKDALETISHDITSGVDKVNSILGNIIEISSDNESISKQHSFDAALKQALSNVFRTEKDIKVSFEYNFNHTQKIQVDYDKVVKASTNIISCILEYIDDEGEILFTTKEFEEGGRELMMVSFRTNPLKATPQDLSNIFDSFHIQSTVNWTDLGLAASKKIISALDCKIDCRVTDERRLEFLFTLPIASWTENVKMPGGLPESSSEIVTEV